MKAYFAGGCFWCMEKPYHMIDGVISAESGYCGGTEENPAYADVKAQRTSHRETVCVEFDETVVSFSELLEVFLNSIDPFDEGGQFIDRGRSYTCAVYYTDEAQKTLAEQRIAEIERDFGKKVAVSVEPYLRFWRAEDYHQDYARKNPEAYRKELEASGRLKTPIDLDNPGSL